VLTYPLFRRWTQEGLSPLLGASGIAAPGRVPPFRPVDASSFPERFIYVAYSPRYGVIITGYQASGPEAICISGFEDLKRQR